MYVVFGNDILVPGEQLSLEMFEDDVNESAVASEIYSLEQPDAVVGLSSPGSWLDYQGVIRVSMLSGSVDVHHANFYVRPYPADTYCWTSVLVPEPRTGVLIALGGVLLATAVRSRRVKRGFSAVAEVDRDRTYPSSFTAHTGFEDQGRQPGRRPPPWPTTAVPLQRPRQNRA